MPKVVKYDITSMSMDITKVEHDPALRVWSDDTIYHNINIILNRWYEPDSKDITIGVFRSLKNFGPRSHNEEDVDIWLHPFKWEKQWHLVVGINPHNKIILINCSKDSKTGFPVETCIEFEQFISHFKSKVTKEALQYPKFCNELLDPTNEDNGINLLTIVLTFCLRPDTLIKLFCDPSTTPRQFDVSDLLPYVINADANFRKTLPNPVETNSPEEPKKPLETEKLDGSNNISQTKKDKSTPKAKHEAENDEISDLESESDSETDSRQPLLRKEVEKETQKEISKEVDSLIKKEIRKDTKKEYKKNNSRSSTQMSSNAQIPPAKRLRSLNGSFEQPIDLDELEDDESAAEEIEYQKEQNSIEKPLPNNNNKQVKKETKSNSVPKRVIKSPVKEPVVENKKEEKVIDIQSLFKKRLPHSFSKLLQMSSFGEGKNEIDIILETIENWTHSKQTNSKLKKDEDDLKKWALLIREHLFVAFTRKTKREFNEDELNELLEVDHSNEIFPLLFENNTIFLVNFHTKDNFKTTINIIVISTRARGEKEIMKNYAFKRLVEMYVWKYNRLITRIRTSVITVTDGTAYEVFMVALYCIHRFIMLCKFDIKFSPNMEQVESYMDNFERLMQSIKNNDELKRNLSYKRLLKHIS